MRKAAYAVPEQAPLHSLRFYTRAKGIPEDLVLNVYEEEVKRLEEDFGIAVGEIDPRVYWRMTDNWLELTVRFLLPDHGGRRIKDAMSREILDGLYKAKIEIASGTYAIVEVPPLKVELANQPR